MTRPRISTTAARCSLWNGETLILVEWSQRMGIGVKTLLQRCRKGWSVEQVLTTPPGGDR
jgi:hypothetical protein